MPSSFSISPNIFNDEEMKSLNIQVLLFRLPEIGEKSPNLLALQL